MFLAFVISGALAGLGGACSSPCSRRSTTAPGSGYELNVIAAVVVGGVAIFGGSGTVWARPSARCCSTPSSRRLVAVRSSSFWDEAIAGALLLAAIAIDRWLSLRVARGLQSAEGLTVTSDMAPSNRHGQSPRPDCARQRPGAGSAPRCGGMPPAGRSAWSWSSSRPSSSAPRSSANFTTKTTLFYAGINTG